MAWLSWNRWRNLQCHHQFLKNLWAQNLFQLSSYQFIKYPTTRWHPLLPRWMPVAVIEAKQISCSVVRIKHQLWGGCIAADAGAVEETQVKDYTSDVHHRVLGLPGPKVIWAVMLPRDLRWQGPQVTGYPVPLFWGPHSRMQNWLFPTVQAIQVPRCCLVRLWSPSL